MSRKKSLVNIWTGIRLENCFCFRNIQQYFLETTLHGLRFIGDNNLRLFERVFFLFAFFGAVFSTANLIAIIYEKWESTPIIIGRDPYPTFVEEIPFPALTLCNMNQLMRSKVESYSKNTAESAMVDIACFVPLESNENDIPENFRNNNLSISDFLIKHSQPCERLLVNCKFNSVEEPCTDLFRETVTDEGQCCVFNLLHPSFRFKNDFEFIRDYTNKRGTVPVTWSPETGYPENLPPHFYPRSGSGYGARVGLSIVLNVEHDEYYCSSTNGPGFKLALHSPIDVPRIREIGFSVATGKEVNLVIDPRSLYSTPLIKTLGPSSRFCYFSDEGDLSFYKIYTVRNCENECLAYYVLEICGCIPYNLPLVLANATICGAAEIYCVYAAQKTWLGSSASCREKCLPSCFDLRFLANGFSTRLVQRNYTVSNEKILKNMTPKFLEENIAVVHLYYQEFSFHGELRNVYIGYIEFLSNSGGILSLFLGFSFISLAELLYFVLLRPFFWWKRNHNVKFMGTESEAELAENSFWLGHEIYQPGRAALLPKRFNNANYLRYGEKEFRAMRKF